METALSEPIGEQVSPQPVLEAAWSFAVTRVLTSAIELDVFTWIARGQTTLEDLAKTTSCSARGLAMLLNALTGLNYLEVRVGRRYGLSPVSAVYLTKTSPHYIGACVLHNTAESWSTWAELSEVIRQGTPARHSVHGDQADVEFFSQLVQSLRRLSADAAAAAARALGNGKPERARKVLDVAAGSAVWSLALANMICRLWSRLLTCPKWWIGLLVGSSIVKASRIALRFGLETFARWILANPLSTSS